jgi:hypothetical protein
MEESLAFMVFANVKVKIAMATYFSYYVFFLAQIVPEKGTNIQSARVQLKFLNQMTIILAQSSGIFGFDD